ncbi:MAG: FHA domain-containing protein [Bacillota bacterium]
MDFVLFLLRFFFLAGLYACVLAVARIIWRELPAGETTAAHAVPLVLCEAVGKVAINGLPWPPGERAVLFLPATFGRQLGNVVQIEDPFVSACHAEIIADGAGLWLFDRGSKNGTWLGERRVVRPAKLKTGDEFRLGGTRFRVEG